MLVLFQFGRFFRSVRSGCFSGERNKRVFFHQQLSLLLALCSPVFSAYSAGEFEGVLLSVEQCSLLSSSCFIAFLSFFLNRGLCD